MTELLNLKITIAGNDDDKKFAILIEGFSKKEQVDYVLDQFNKFMTDNSTMVIQ